MKELFTKQERSVVLFLISGILIGTAVKIFNPDIKEENPHKENFAQFEDIIKKLDTTKVETKNFRQNRSKEDLYQDFKIDINKATIDELIRLPKVGPVLAKRIIEYRDKIGGFRNINQLINVKGVGNKTLERLKPFIFVTPKE